MSNPTPQTSMGQPRLKISVGRFLEMVAPQNQTGKDQQSVDLGTPGTPFSFSNAHAEKGDILSIPEMYHNTHTLKVPEKGVPTVPNPPEPPPRTSSPSFLPKMGPLIRSLETTDPNYEEPKDGSLVVGLYRSEDHTVTPVLLWASTEADLFWDVVERGYVHPPRFYIPISDVCPFDPYTGYAIVDGAICPF